MSVSQVTQSSVYTHKTLPNNNKCIATIAIIVCLALGSVVVGIMAIAASFSGGGALSQIGLPGGAAFTTVGMVTLVVSVIITVIHQCNIKEAAAKAQQEVKDRKAAAEAKAHLDAKLKKVTTPKTITRNVPTTPRAKKKDIIPGKTDPNNTLANPSIPALQTHTTTSATNAQIVTPTENTLNASQSKKNEQENPLDTMKRNEEEVGWLFRAVWAAFSEEATKPVCMYHIASQMGGIAHLVIGSPTHGVQHLYIPEEEIEGMLLSASNREHYPHTSEKFIEMDLAKWKKLQLGEQEKISLSINTFQLENTYWIEQEHLSEREFVVVEKSEHICILVRHQDKRSRRANKTTKHTEILFFRKECPRFATAFAQLQQDKYSQMNFEQ